MLYTYLKYNIITVLFNRVLRQFSWVRRMTGSFLPTSVFMRAWDFFDSDKVRMYEGCIEAPFQMTLLMYVISSGKWPGRNIWISTRYTLIMKRAIWLNTLPFILIGFNANLIFRNNSNSIHGCKSCFNYFKYGNRKRIREWLEYIFNDFS